MTISHHPSLCSDRCPCRNQTDGAAEAVSTVIKTVPPKDGMRGYQVHALQPGAPLPGGQQIAHVEDYGSDAHLLVIDSDGRKRCMNRHTRIHQLDTGAVSLILPEYDGWAAD
ncbi:hypothetical protein [Nonomuraea angiospora]